MIFDFKLPVSGKAVQWKPLKVGDQIDIAASLQGQQQIYLNMSLYAARICKYQSDQGDKASCSLAEIKQWDEIDYNLFVSEVDIKEAERWNSFKKKDEPHVVSMKLQKAAMDAREAMLDAMKKLDIAVDAAKASEAASAAPLRAVSG